MADPLQQDVATDEILFSEDPLQDILDEETDTDAEEVSYDTEIPDFRACMDDANMYRSLHMDTPLMEYDDELAEGAMQWAQHIVEVKFEHYKEKTGTGENLAKGWGRKRLSLVDKCKGANALWYSEAKRYIGYDPTNKLGIGVGHFSQMMWRDSVKVGYAVYETDTMFRGKMMNTWGVVARYRPSGNFQSFEKHAANVLPCKSVAESPPGTIIMNDDQDGTFECYPENFSDVYKTVKSRPYDF